MKRVLLVIIGCLIFCTSCIGAFQKEIDGGFPDKVTFPKEGGELSLTGEIPIYSIGIYYSGNQSGHRKKEDGSIEASLDWLTVRAKMGSNTIYLYADPKNNNKGRTFYVNLNHSDGYGEYVEIKVKQ
ncbi:MAG: hypothetical protein IKK02_00780 [Tidjanibacter sp.]|nr:hypothetical protein [Tidjanibacter sp.]MBR6813955.1 hypothetical protein [Tidjanibacter sp.]